MLVLKQKVTLRPLHVILIVLFAGPVVAPLFQATRLPLLADSGTLARDLLAHYVCPTPARSYLLLGFPMAVCARCWGGTIGLWAAWWLVHSSGRSAIHFRAAYGTSGMLGQIVLAALAFGLWVIEIQLWPAAPAAVLLLNGANAGLWGGLLINQNWASICKAWASRSL